MGRVDLYQCDNERCPDEAETRDIEKAQWWTVARANGSVLLYFCMESCMKAWIVDRGH